MYISPETIESWPPPNYTNPIERRPWVITINLILYILVLGVVGLRTVTRLFISRSFGADDITILIAMIPTTAFVTVTLIAEFCYGWNRHAWDVPLDEVAPGLKLSLASQVLFSAASTCTRLSMLFLTRRILTTGYEILRKVIIFAMVLMAVHCSIFITVVIFQCRPISAFWTFSLVPQNCIDQKTNLLVQGIINILSDFCVVLIPIPIVLRLNLPLRQRILVALLFGAAFIVCIAGIVRTYYFYRLTDGYHDITWDAFPVWLSTAVELYIGIVCTSAPPTKPFFVRYLPKLLTATSQYFPTTHDQSSTLASSKNITKHTSSLKSRELEDRAGMEFEEISGRLDNAQIHKTVEISQSWHDVSRIRACPSKESTEKLVRQHCIDC